MLLCKFAIPLKCHELYNPSYSVSIFYLTSMQFNRPISNASLHLKVCTKGIMRVCFMTAFFAWHHESKWAHKNIFDEHCTSKCWTLRAEFIFEIKGRSIFLVLSSFCYLMWVSKVKSLKKEKICEKEKERTILVWFVKQVNCTHFNCVTKCSGDQNTKKFCIRIIKACLIIQWSSFYKSSTFHVVPFRDLPLYI